MLFALAACKAPPARLVAGIADTVVVNNVVPVRMPMHVFDAAGHALPDTGVRFQWTSGLAVPVSDKGVLKCTQAGDATLRASLGALVTPFLVRCRPVHDVFGGRVLNLLVGDSSQDLSFAPVDSAGRPVTLFTAGVSYDSTVVALEGWRIRPRGPGQTSVEIYIGDSWTSWFVRVYERASTVEGIRLGQGLAVSVRLAGGEMHSLQLPPSPPPYSVTMLPDRDTLRVPLLAMLSANCQGGFTTSQRSYRCFALQGASVVAYHPKDQHPKEKWSGTIAVWREARP
ncbi:MAG: hypothetical protein E6J18_16065 [Chloroflexi bacterium]|nr:MAG: hypothetical protein E6J18_16065 [Chloroflexota bacterium]